MSLLAFLLSCLQPGEAPEACVQMCAAATPAYEACLDERGLGWENAGYSDAEDFQASCETWAWEWTLIEAEEGERGATAEACEGREVELSAGEGCEGWEAVSWQEAPWE